MASAVLDLIKDTMRLVGALPVGQTPSADDAVVVLRIFNGIIDSWSTQRWMISAFDQQDIPWAANIVSKQLGPTSNPVYIRPIKVENACLVDINGVETPLWLFNENDFIYFQQKEGPGVTQNFFYNPTFPLGTIYLLPVPQIDVTLRLRQWSAMGNYGPTLVGAPLIQWPPGYEKALIYSAAPEASMHFLGKAADPQIGVIGMEAVNYIKSINAKTIRLPVPKFIPRRWGIFNIFQGGNS